MKKFWILVVSCLTALFCFAACKPSSEDPGPSGDEETYVIAVTKNLNHAGEVTGAGEYEEGTIVTLVATDNEGYYFWAWFLDGQEVTKSATLTITVTEDKTYEARWFKTPDEPWTDGPV